MNITVNGTYKTSNNQPEKDSIATKWNNNESVHVSQSFQCGILTNRIGNKPVHVARVSRVFLDPGPVQSFSTNYLTPPIINHNVFD